MTNKKLRVEPIKSVLDGSKIRLDGSKIRRKK